MFKKSIGSHILEVSHKRIERPEKSVYFNHIHNHCELLLFIEGNARYNIDGKVFTPSPYDLIFIPAATYHYLIPTSTAPYENYVIGIEPSLIPKEHYKKLFSPPFMINIKENTELTGFFSRLDLYCESFSNADFDRCAEALIIELLTYCSYKKSTITDTHNSGATLIDKIIDCINENIHEPLDSETIADHLHLSVSYVQNIFSQKMKIGLKKYIMQKKIYAAHKDISKGLAPSDACEKYSIGDYSTFYRLYKKHFGSSPREKR